MSAIDVVLFNLVRTPIGTYVGSLLVFPAPFIERMMVGLVNNKRRLKWN